MTTNYQILNDINECNINDINECNINDINECNINDINECNINDINECNKNDINEYTMEDMNEYNSFFKKNNINKSFFIECLNQITDPKNIVCDFNFVLSYIRELNIDIYKYIRNHLAHPSDYYVWYFYFKFLLLDDNNKNLFYDKYFIPISNFKSYILYGLISNKTILSNKEHINDILKKIYNYIQYEDELNNFMDFKDNYRNYQRLDISKIQNILYKMDKYMNNYTLSSIFYFIQNYNSIQLLYHFIYYNNVYVYNIIYIKIDDENDDYKVNGLSEFIDMFNSSINIYIKMWNFINDTKYNGLNNNIENIEEFISNIPVDIYANPSNNFDYYKINNEEDKYNIIINLFRYTFFDVINNYNTNIKKKFQSYIHIFLNKGKDIIYIDNMLEYINPDPFNNGLYLYKRYMNYCNSKLLDGLTFMNLQVYSVLLKKKYLNNDLKELKTFLEKIFKEYNYKYYTRFDYID